MPKKRHKKRKLTQAFYGAMSGGRGEAKPVTLPQAPWDHGATGQANQHGLIVEPATEIDPETGKETPNPNGITRVRRRPWVSTYERQGKLTPDQANIARELRDAAEGARNADPLAAIGNRIDRDTAAPDPQAVAFDARRKFHRMWPLVPVWAQYVIEAVVIEDRPIGSFARGGSADRQMQRLAQGLDELRQKWPKG